MARSFLTNQAKNTKSQKIQNKITKQTKQIERLASIMMMSTPNAAVTIISNEEDDQPKVVDCEMQRFLGIVGKGPFDSFGPQFQKGSKIAADANLFRHSNVKMAMLVLCDVPNTEKADLVWATAIRVPSTLEDIPDEPEEIVIPAGRYGTTIHKGGYEGLPKAWGNLCREWIPSHNLNPSKVSRECIHYDVYLNDCSDGQTKKEDLLSLLWALVDEV